MNTSEQETTVKRRRKGEAHHNLDLEQTYESVRLLIYQLAWRHSHTYGLSFDDCLSECNWAFMRAFYNRFDDRRGTTFSTFLQTLIQFRFRTMQYRKTYKSIQTDELDENLSVPAPQAKVPVAALLPELSEDAREMLWMLLDAPKQIASEAEPRELFVQVKKSLRRSGLSRKEVKKAELELQTMLREQWAQN